LADTNAALQLYDVQLNTDKTNTSDLACGAFKILISFSWSIKIQNPSLFHKFRPKLAKSDVTKEALDFIAADSIVDAVSFISKQFLLKSGSGWI